MDVSDAEKELARLKRRVFKLEDDIEGKEYERNALVQKRRGLEKELTALKKERQATVVDGEFSDNSAIDSKIAKIKKEISTIEGQIEKVDQAIEKGNISLEQTKNRYVEIAQKARELKAEVKDGVDSARTDEAAERRAAFEERQGQIAERLQKNLRATAEITSVVAGFIKEKLSPVFGPVYQRMAPTLDRIKQKIYDSLDLEEAKKRFLIGIKGIYNALDLGEAKRRLLAGVKGISGGISNLFGKLGPTTKTVFSGVKTSISGMFSAFKAASPQILAAVAAVKSVISVLQRAWDMAVKFAAGFANALKRGAAAVYDFGRAVAKNFVASIKAIGKFAGNLAKSVSSITKKIVQLTKKFNIFSKIAEALGGVFKQLGSTIKQALVFSVIYQGLSMVRQQMGSYLMVNEQFSEALRRLQGVLLTAFQPIYDAVLPALTSLISALASAIATVTQFFASLFGTTAKKAQSNAKALYGQAKALEATGEAAKDAEKAFASFDEVEVLGNKKEDTSGAGGGISAETGPLFDFEYEDSKFESWGEAFSAFLDKLLDGIQKLRDKFKDFADWINEFSKKLYDMFTFPGVLEKVEQLGRDLANALNDLVNWIDWYQLGQALGAGLNLALQFLTEFLYTFDWMNLGRKLAEFVNGLVSEIDWYDFGRLLWAGFKIGLETLAGFILGLDMPQLAQAASNIVKGFFDEMYNTIAKIPWQEIGRQFSRFLNNIDWHGTITSVLTAIQAAFVALVGMIAGFVDELDWAGIARGIYTAINDSLGQVDWYGIGHVIGDAFVHVFDFVRDIVNGISWYQIGQNIADLILGFDFVSALGSLADLIAAGINAAISLARGFLDKILPEVQGIAEGIAERLRQAVSSVKWDELGGVIGDGIKAALTFVAGLLDPDLFYEIGKAIGDFLVGLDWVGIVGALSEVLANAIASAVAAVNGVLDSAEPNLKEIAEGIGKKINEFVEKVNWKELGQTLARGLNAAFEFLSTLLDTIDWAGICDGIIEFFNSALRETDWEKIGKTWGETLKAKIEAVTEFLAKIDWAGIVRAIVDFLAGVDWVGLAADITKGLFELLGAAVEGVLALIMDLPGILQIGGDIGAGILEGILKALVGLPQWLKEHVVDPIVDGVKDLFGIHSPSTVMAEIGESVIDGLLKGIKDTWDSIVDFFEEKVEALQDFFSDAWDAIKETASSAWEAIKETLGGIWDSIKEKAVEIYTAIKDKITEVWNSIKETASTVWEAIKTTVTGIWEGLKTAATTAFNAVKDAVVGVWEAIKNSTQSIWDGIWGTIKKVINSILGGVESMVNGVIRALNKMISALNSLHVDVPDWVPAIGGKSLGFNIPSISEVNIPRLAQGAVIPPNREFLAVLGDQRTGTNIEAPLSDIENAVSRAIAASGFAGGNRNITVIMEMNKRELGRVVYQLNNEETQRVGVRLTEVKS